MNHAKKATPQPRPAKKPAAAVKKIKTIKIRTGVRAGRCVCSYAS